MKPLLDSRAEQTRSALLRAFAELIFRDGFENISVQAIAAEAGTARSTFYEHFGGKEDILRASMGPFFAIIADCTVSDSEPQHLRRVLDHMWENRRLADAIFTGHARTVLSRNQADFIEARLKTLGPAGRLPARLAAIHIGEAQLALVESWLRGRAFARTEDVATALHHSSRASALALAAS